MNNREIEKRLQRAVDQITPDVLDKVRERVAAEQEGTIPMDLSRRRKKRGISAGWIVAAAALLVLGVGGLLYFGVFGGKLGNRVVVLDPHVPTAGEALLIDQIVAIDPDYTPEELAAYSISELDTILSNVKKPAEEAPVVVNEEPEPVIPVTEEPEELPEEETAAAVSEDKAAEAVSQNAVSENEAETLSAVGSTDEEQYDPEDGEAVRLLTDRQALEWALKDAGIREEMTGEYSVSSVMHTSYGLVYTVEFETEGYRYHYRVAEDGTILAAGKERIENE
ncbi:MAG: hypothetical protein K6E50_02785 [Lachnospiraceae bacterium]|nr:hypothetical protein [Lachnospiraceae bacterium]